LGCSLVPRSERELALFDMTGRGVFLDTTIQIASVVHCRRTKERIRLKIKSFDCSVTSLVVWQEFKRRLLKDAQYLLNWLNYYGSYNETMRRVTRLPPQQRRKQMICLGTLQSIFEHAGARKGDAELAERARRYLRTLIRLGRQRFEQNVDLLLTDCGCACSKQAIVEKTPYRKYEFGPDKCSAVASSCGIGRFLQGKRTELSKIQAAIQALSDVNRTKELSDAGAFISEVVDGSTDATKADPCMKVGDLLIALESSTMPYFCTMNVKESSVLCPALGQQIVIVPVNPDAPDSTVPCTV
jgi:hypothetical protein